jgi:hypothetical protein
VPWSRKPATRITDAIRPLSQVKKIATDKLREAFKDVQPQLEQPHRNNSTSNDKAVRGNSELDELKAGINSGMQEK